MHENLLFILIAIGVVASVGFVVMCALVWNYWSYVVKGIQGMTQKTKHDKKSRKTRDKKKSSSSDEDSKSDDKNKDKTKRKKRARARASASDEDTDEKEKKRSGILKTRLKQSASTYVDPRDSLAALKASTPAVKAGPSGIDISQIANNQSGLIQPKSLTFDTSINNNTSYATTNTTGTTVINTAKVLTAQELNRFSPSSSKLTPNAAQFQSTIAGNANQQTCVNQAPPLMNDIGRIMARKPDVYDGETSIDDWVDSMRAYIEGTNPGVTTDKVRVSLIKLFMGPNALRMVKHILKEDYCDWVALKKCLESVFNRHTMKYSTLNTHFLLREQKSDESFASFFKDLWGLCDEMAAMKPIEDAEKEDMVVGRFAEGIHNVIVRNSVKQYVNTHGLIDGFISRNVFDAAKFYARDTGVEEQYFKSYNETASLLKKRQDPDKRLSVSNINYVGYCEIILLEKRYQDSGSRSTTPDETNLRRRLTTTLPTTRPSDLLQSPTERSCIEVLT